MIKTKKNVVGHNKRTSKELPDESEETRNSHLEKRSQILQNSAPPIDSSGHSVEMDIEQVPEPPLRRESRARSNSSNSASSGGGGGPTMSDHVKPNIRGEDDDMECGIKKFCEVSFEVKFSILSMMKVEQSPSNMMMMIQDEKQDGCC